MLLKKENEKKLSLGDNSNINNKQKENNNTII